jgi:Na+-driven multidrug efflux pump
LLKHAHVENNANPHYRTVLANIANAVLRAEGDARRAMIAMVLGSGLNIGLDPVFIYVLDLGVSGAAWATVVSYGISSLMMFNWRETSNWASSIMTIQFCPAARISNTIVRRSSIKPSLVRLPVFPPSS